ncbi:hypothetical protein O3M35_000176 [Rhynocoris fuscipes]|uniref:Uncharacterized protein n=1 Tax=Rhynocoris fuscipes TaxID=488301 RepID=A0AAW1DP93_9HEMI
MVGVLLLQESVDVPLKATMVSFQPYRKCCNGEAVTIVVVEEGAKEGGERGYNDDDDDDDDLDVHVDSNRESLLNNDGLLDRHYIVKEEDYDDDDDECKREGGGNAICNGTHLSNGGTDTSAPYTECIPPNRKNHLTASCVDANDEGRRDKKSFMCCKEARAVPYTTSNKITPATNYHECFD